MQTNSDTHQETNHPSSIPQKTNSKEKIKVNIKTPHPLATRKRLILSVTGAIVCILCGMLYSINNSSFNKNNSNINTTNKNSNNQNNNSGNNSSNNSNNNSNGNSNNNSNNNSSAPTLEFAKNTEADIKPSSDKLNIYVFWGDGCPHCKHLANFLGEKKSEIGDKINLYSFEVWNDKNNLAFLKSFGKFLGETPKGVPYLIIGSKTYSGFSDSDDATKQEIIDLIKTEAKKSNKIDKYQEYKKTK